MLSVEERQSFALSMETKGDIKSDAFSLISTTVPAASETLPIPNKALITLFLQQRFFVLQL
jgi:hypothetical protein